MIGILLSKAHTEKFLSHIGGASHMKQAFFIYVISRLRTKPASIGPLFACLGAITVVPRLLFLLIFEKTFWLV